MFIFLLDKRSQSSKSKFEFSQQIFFQCLIWFRVQFAFTTQIRSNFEKYLDPWLYIL